MKKTMENNMKWRERRFNMIAESSNNRNVRVTGAKADDAPMTKHHQILADLRRMSEEQQRASNIAAIEGRMMAGRRLSPSELAFLRDNAPEMYDKAIRIERERREYERELANARSKEDVDRIHQKYIKQFVMEAKSVKRSDMPKSEKLAAMKTIQMRMSAVVSSRFEFMQSELYRNLPDTDEESNKLFSIPIRMNDIGDLLHFLNNLIARFTAPAAENEVSEAAALLDIEA
jgi:hypothetical protein